MGLGKRIRELRQARGWTLDKLEEESGVAVGTISALEQRDSSRSQYFPQLARALGLSVEALQNATDAELNQIIHGVNEGNVPGALLARFERKPFSPAPAPSMQPILSWEHEEDLPPGEFVMVPRLDVHLSAGAGHGSTQVEILFDEALPQAFRADWIRGQHLRPKKLAAMTARGDSMEPTIFDGDSLLVDTSQTEVLDKKVYALWYDGGERVKRLFRLPGGGLRIKSDNPEYDTIELGPDYAGHVRVIGRVVHRSGRGGL